MTFAKNRKSDHQSSNCGDQISDSFVACTLKYNPLRPKTIENC